MDAKDGQDFDDIFRNKLAKHEYISTFLFQNISSQLKSTLNHGFDLEDYNSEVIRNIYDSNKSYFETIYQDIDPKVKLDEQQLTAVIADEKYSLIIAGAGTGKTTTVAAKVKYLVDKKNVNPDDILVLSYTRNAVNELRERINIDLGIPADITTFHSLGYRNIRQKDKNAKHIIADENLINRIFVDYFREKIYDSPNNLEKFINCFNNNVIQSNNTLYGNFLLENYQSYHNFDEYFPAYVEHKVAHTEEREIIAKLNRLEEANANKEQPTTLLGEFVKSRGEALIANFLYRNSIEYEYEKVYSEVVADNRVYRPDFTLNIGGETVYIEYFGLSNFNFNENNPTYEKNRRLKEEYHAKNHTNFIALDNKPHQNIIATLAKELMERFGAKLESRSPEDIYRTYLLRNKSAEFFNVQKFFTDRVKTIKSSKHRDDYFEFLNNYISSSMVDYDQTIANKQLDYISDFYQYYENYLHSRKDVQYYDYFDLLYYGRKFTQDNFKYIIIDEYQDISFERYALAKETIKNSDANLIAVGDDWQTIYSFAGSRIDYIIEFQKFFPGSKLFYITHTYRNAQQLIDCSGKFIMRNNFQIKKGLTSPKDNPIPFHQLTYKSYGELTKKLYCDIIRVHHEYPNDSITLLARKNKDLKALTSSYGIFESIKFFTNGIGQELRLKSPRNLEIAFQNTDIYKKLNAWYDPDFTVNAMTIHKSKGLTTDHTYLLGLDKSFPNKCPVYWIDTAISEEPIKEPIEYAEERRVFYVALTRTKNEVTLCLSKDVTNRSPFINELKLIEEEVLDVS